MSEWVPKTKLGRLVAEGQITSMEEVFASGLPLMEPEIVDHLLDLEHAVLDSTPTIRVTDSGRRRSLRVAVVVGNKDGYVGVGIGKGKAFRDALDAAIRRAKLNIIRVRRGCGSWECGCGTPHSIPFKVEGKCSSVRVTLMPAPKGVGIVVPDSVKPVLQLAGVKDVWEKTRGNTRSTINFALAIVDALKQTVSTKIPEKVIAKTGADF